MQRSDQKKRRQNKKEKSTILFTEVQAQRQIYEHNGHYYKLCNENDDILYFHVNKSYSKYKNGFLPFHTMIYDNMRMTLNNLYIIFN